MTKKPASKKQARKNSDSDQGWFLKEYQETKDVKRWEGARGLKTVFRTLVLHVYSGPAA